MPSSSTLTTTSYAVLGLLAIRPWTTYEMTRQMQRSLSRLWPRAASKLAQHGLAAGTEERTGQRTRRRHTITEQGRSQLATWLATPAQDPALELEFLVRVFLAEHGTRDDLLATLTAVNAVVSYGQNLSVLVSDDTFAGGPGAPPQVVGAQDKLAATFGLMYICDPDTYEGTIKRSPDFPVPGMSELDATTPAWFSCLIDGAEGVEDFSAQAVGWTSGKTAWLTVGLDDAAVREFVTALHQAQG